eukprot:TRINITY_DN15018_c0_g1_i1.p1 TRINITY_DN15018_c0_g1~~TRINITY_DN15018_c0_g1_i1.p1  ORF type:complete len:347 (+),score=92.67 TRINITY_DN15018_c0_g1_i1:179-1219(+)
MEKEASDSPKPGTTEPKAILVMKSPPAEILDYLYLGNQQQGANKKMLKEIGITRILSVKESFGLPPPNPDFEVLHMPMSDYGNQDLRELMDQCIDFIEQTKHKHEKILVHCRLGVNRSTTIVLAYLMLRERWTLKQAWTHVKTQRTPALPQQGYWLQLIALEKDLFGRETMSLADVQPLLDEFARQAQRARGGLLRLPGGAESGQPASERPPSPRETHPVQRNFTAPNLNFTAPNLNSYASNTMQLSTSSDSVMSNASGSSKSKKDKKDKKEKSKDKDLKKSKEDKKKEKLNKSKEKKEKEKKKKDKKTESKKRKESERSNGDEKEGIFKKPQLKRIRTSSSLGGE